MTARIAFLICVLCVAPVTPSYAQPGPNEQHIANCRTATAIVLDSQKRGIGTAFCIHPDGYFLTSAFLMPGIGTEVSLVIAPTGKEAELTTAQVVRSSLGFDLALLRVKQRDPLPSLKIGRKDRPDLTAFGFSELADFPALGVLTSSSISAGIEQADARGVRGKLPSLLPKPYAGGPILNSKGEVCGIIDGRPLSEQDMRIRGSNKVLDGCKFIKDSIVINKFLGEPQIEVTRGEQTAPGEFTLEFAVKFEEAFWEGPPSARVTSPRSDVSIVMTDLDGGRFRATLSYSPASLTPPIAVAELGATRVRGTLRNPTDGLGKDLLQWSDILRLARLEDDLLVVCRDAEQHSFPLDTSGSLRIQIAGKEVEIPIEDVTKLAILHPHSSVESVPYSIQLQTAHLK